ncbi:hypothetical protein AVEN_134181-1 [Araneus ventricosus]|uniref:Uncharacterized protein n=1 Tax=Araneus ventricosus TaxID=182803 RepID=A0A4Y2VJA7_ARAVE|nr:hypothetical protein AVEN_134181-1 [Araneus ventricosus]
MAYVAAPRWSRTQCAHSPNSQLSWASASIQTARGPPQGWWDTRHMVARQEPGKSLPQIDHLAAWYPTTADRGARKQLRRHSDWPRTTTQSQGDHRVVELMLTIFCHDRVVSSKGGLKALSHCEYRA